MVRKPQANSVQRRVSMQPALADPAGDQRGDGEGERHGEADVAEVEHRRVEHHEDVVLQQRVRAGAVAWGRPPADRLERVGRPEHQQEEEDADTTNSMTSAQPTSGSSSRCRKWTRDGDRVAGEHEQPTAGSSPRARSTGRRS